MLGESGRLNWWVCASSKWHFHVFLLTPILDPKNHRFLEAALNVEGVDDKYVYVQYAK